MTLEEMTRDFHAMRKRWAAQNVPASEACYAICVAICEWAKAQPDGAGALDAMLKHMRMIFHDGVFSSTETHFERDN